MATPTPRRGAAKRSAPGRPRVKPTAAPPIADAATITTGGNPENLAPNTTAVERDAVIADTQDPATFTTTESGGVGIDILQTEAAPVDRVIDPDAPLLSPDPSADSNDPLSAPGASPNIGRNPNWPDGFIVQVGQRLTKLPVRRVGNDDTMVEAREDVYVERRAAGSKRSIFTLLMAAGTVFRKVELDQVAS